MRSARVRSARVRAPLVSARLCSDWAPACCLLRLLRRRAAVLRSGAFLFSFSCFLCFPLLHARFRISLFMLMYSIYFFRCHAAGFFRYTICNIGIQRGYLDDMKVTCMFGVGTSKVLYID